ncbi:DUF3793 family protein [Lacrimispora sp. NSJ-141]|uniref:DUF3793 family protein n=1 Tax=Lientehia hominis TaxID=2897778 RepID=A0AAP2RGH3_9FIRM|nr:DUF3793 family protein [Lientehia hominis]MCD2491566.1 DUF3793 family protein [Lientehia hominis]
MLLEKHLIEHCAPTLASLKTASLFCLSVTAEAGVEEQLKDWNERLMEKGLFLSVLRRRRDRALIYVYRRSHLQKDLRKPGVEEFLAEYGYCGTNAEYALRRLKERLRENNAFPHEIGVFLGYPLDDVKGFIQNSGKNSKCSGCWQVYGDEYEAKRLFERMEKCREIYVKLWNQGRTVWQLTVAA